jgi:hypothetical protein
MDQPLQTNRPGKGTILMSSYAYDLLRGGERKEPELLSSAPRPRAAQAPDDSGGADDTRRESDSEQVAA